MAEADSPRTEPSHVLGVFGLSKFTDEDGLRAAFAAHGALRSVNLVTDRYTNTSRCFAFVYYETLDDATAARAALNGSSLDGRTIRVDYSATLKPHDPTPGRYMGDRPRPGGRSADTYIGRSRSDYRGGAGNSRHSEQPPRDRSPGRRHMDSYAPSGRRDSRPHDRRDAQPYDRRDAPPHDRRDAPPHDRRDAQPYDRRDTQPYDRRDAQPYDRRERHPRDSYSTRGTVGHSGGDNYSHSPYPRGESLPHEESRRRSSPSPPRQREMRGRSRSPVPRPPVRARSPISGFY